MANISRLSLIAINFSGTRHCFTYRLHHNYSTKCFGTKSKCDQNLEPFTVSEFDWKVLIKGLTKSGTKFGHFSFSMENKMKPRGIFMHKKALFLSHSCQPLILNKFWKKMCRNFCRISFNFYRNTHFYYICSQNATVTNNNDFWKFLLQLWLCHTCWTPV